MCMVAKGLRRDQSSHNSSLQPLIFLLKALVSPQFKRQRVIYMELAIFLRIDLKQLLSCDSLDEMEERRDVGHVRNG